jgi:hypothetical protein
MDLRCPHRKFGEVIDELYKVTCPSRWCGKRDGVTVLHTFNIRTGELVETHLFKTPQRRD